jgi:hypothetical protein
MKTMKFLVLSISSLLHMTILGGKIIYHVVFQKENLSSCHMNRKCHAQIRFNYSKIFLYDI